MSQSRLKFLRGVAQSFKAHPVLNLHIQTEMKLLSDKQNDGICRRCAKALTHMDEVEVRTKGRKAFRSTKLVVKCSFCGGTARSVLIQKRPSLPKKPKPSTMLEIAKSTKATLPSVTSQQSKKKRKRGKDTNAGLIIPPSFKKTVTPTPPDNSRLLRMLQSEAKFQAKGPKTLLDKFFK